MRNENLINTFCNRPNMKKSLMTNWSLPQLFLLYLTTISTTKINSRSCSTININITRRLTVQIPKGLQVNNLRTWPACGARCVHQASIQLQVRYQVEETDTILTEDSLQNWYLMAGQHILSYIQWRTVFRWSFMQSLLCLGNINSLSIILLRPSIAMNYIAINKIAKHYLFIPHNSLYVDIKIKNPFLRSEQ